MDATILLTAAFIIMALGNVAVLFWALYLDRRLRGKPIPKRYDVHVEGTKVFSEPELAEIQKRANAQLDQAVKMAFENLENTIGKSVDQLAAHVNEAAENSIRQEFDKYQASLRALNNTTVEQFGQIQADLQTQRTALAEQLKAEVAAERERRLATFNNRINDVISSYLAETLGNRVDLGAQTEYILDSLEQHKNDLKRDILA